MSVGFGFSIGDILAVGDLARKIVQALDESRGAPADYKSLCELLLSLHRSLHAVSAIFFYPALGNGSIPDPALLNGIRYELGCCKQLMDEFLVSSRKYTESLLNGRPGKRFKDEWRKITWSLYKAEDIQKLQTRLQGHITAFQLYSFAVSWQSLARTEQKSIENTEISNRIELRIIDMFTLLKSYHDNLPKVMGYPGGCNQKPIYFEDALGRAVDLPLMLCRNKDSFHDILEIMFKDRPGRKRVIAKEYEVIDAKGSPIEDLDWELKVLPGTRIAMGILIKAIAKSGTGFGDATHKCPRCNASNAGAMIEQGSLKCCYCSLIFRTLDIERVVELPDHSTEEGSESVHLRAGPSKLVVEGGNSTRLQTVERKARSEVDMPNDEDIFRRIHYRREVLKYQTRSSPKGSIPDCLQSSANCEAQSVSIMQAAQLSLESIRKALGEEHPEALDAMLKLADAYDRVGRWAEIEEPWVRALEARVRVFGKEKPEFLDVAVKFLSSIDMVGRPGRWKEAKELRVQVLETKGRVLGKEHPETLNTMARVASSYAMRGRWKEAEELRVQVLEVEGRVLGKEHPETLSTMASLASSYFMQRRWKELGDLRVQVLEAKGRLLGKEHPETLEATADLASSYELQGRSKEAEELRSRLPPS